MENVALEILNWGTQVFRCSCAMMLYLEPFLGWEEEALAFRLVFLTVVDAERVGSWAGTRPRVFPTRSRARRGEQLDLKTDDNGTSATT